MARHLLGKVNWFEDGKNCNLIVKTISSANSGPPSAPPAPGGPAGGENSRSGKKPLLGLFVMIDAMGWEILRPDPFGKSFAPTRKRLDSVFGYSSACVPSILSGRWPVEHRNWCYFVHDPAHSPFRWLRWLRWLPKAATSRRIFRRWLT